MTRLWLAGIAVARTLAACSPGHRETRPRHGRTLLVTSLTSQRLETVNVADLP